jgi:hypothetical protein
MFFFEELTFTQLVNVFSFHKNQPLDPTLFQLNLVHIFTTYMYKICFNIIISYV